ncbi:TMEM175 family protein [uncultured Microbacterium sp.]|uniref:TMEM175 family protein n=1 Tax=uncultured Microbacterium sp. TaxID=191216 RepID=UPI0035C9CC69
MSGDDGGAIDETGTALRFASSERVKAFTDAVVAIAMTLLILPLLDTIGEAATENQTTLEWLQQNSGSLFVFVLSFVIIANFWTSHHRLFARVEHVSEGLLWITIAWMLTIVWLPVATSMTGQMESDALQRTLYIGSMAITSILLFSARLYLRRHPQLHDIRASDLRRGLVADVATAIMFVVSLAVAVIFPTVGYAALFLMFLVGPLHTLGMRIIGDPRPE